METKAIAFPLIGLLSLAALKTRDDLDQLDAIGFFVAVVLMAPVFETVVFQLLPIVVLRWLCVPFSWQVGISAFLFWRAHAAVSVSTGICAGLVGGVYLGYSYAYWAQRSLVTAYWTTMVQHMLGNAIIFLLVVIFGGFSEGGPWVPMWLFYATMFLGPIPYWICLARDASYRCCDETNELDANDSPQSSEVLQ